MMRAVSVLRNLLKMGQVLEIRKGVWMASHVIKIGQTHSKMAGKT